MLKFKHLLIIASSLVAFAVMLNLSWGAVTLTAWDDPILWSIRLPRLLTGLCCAGAIATAGVLSQALFQNPLASPSVIGTESGAALGVALFAMIFGLSVATPLHTIAGSALVGGTFATLATFAAGKLAARGQDYRTFLLAGVALSAFFGSITTLIATVLMDQDERGLALLNWLLGSFSGRTWMHFFIVAVATTIGTALAMVVSRKLDLLSLGVESAESLGVDCRRLQLYCLTAIGLLVGSSLAVGGALPFVSLLIPHLVRSLQGPKARPLIISSIVSSMALVTLADFLCRSLLSPRELPIGLVTTLIGAPYLFYVLLRDPDAHQA
jgi:iron complex transport system permease protein